MNLAFLKENFGLKLLSLFLGTTLYVFVQSLESARSTKTFQIPLRVDANNPDLALVSVTDADGRTKRTISVTMKGLAEELAELDTAKIQKSLSAWVDLSQGQVGDMNYPVFVRWAPEYNKFSWEWERRVNVLTEPIARISRPVKLVTTGAPQAGVDYGDASVAPPSVEIVGPESSVQRVQTVRVLLDLQKAESGVVQRLTVETLDAAQKPVVGVAASPESVEVRPVLTPASPWREVFVAPSFSGVPAPGFRVARYSVDPEVVQVQGDPNSLRILASVSTTPVDISTLTGPIQRIVEVVLPRGLRLKNPKRIRVRVTIEADPAGTPGTVGPGQ